MLWVFHHHHPARSGLPFNFRNVSQLLDCVFTLVLLELYVDYRNISMLL